MYIHYGRARTRRNRGHRLTNLLVLRGRRAAQAYQEER